MRKGEASGLSALLLPNEILSMPAQSARRLVEEFGEEALTVIDKGEKHTKTIAATVVFLVLALLAIPRFFAASTLLGVVVFLCSVVLGIWSLWQKVTGQALEGFTTVILLQLLIGSILMICLGIIGYYIAKIYEEIKDRPRYVV